MLNLWWYELLSINLCMQSFNNHSNIHHKKKWILKSVTQQTPWKTKYHLPNMHVICADSLSYCVWYTLMILPRYIPCLLQVKEPCAIKLISNKMGFHFFIFFFFLWQVSSYNTPIKYSCNERKTNIYMLLSFTC